MQAETLAAHSVENVFSARSAELSFWTLGPSVGSALTIEYQKRKCVLRKANPTAVTFWQTASLHHLSTAYAARTFVLPNTAA